ncbi:MAG TPA: dephospho-CoA kinase [Ignavibacteria bacterium]|nr:dephospho-CoA kinase [Ignavibacteria bacterium]
MNSKKLKIAVTGNIGSGKSTFCNYIESKGYKVLRADDIAKEILVNDENVKSEVIREFGTETFNGKELNKKFLAETVFSDPQKVQLINSIIHPVVIKNLNEQINSLLVNENIVFVEAALIYEAGMEELFNYVVLISSELRNRFKRKEKSDNYSFEEFKRREENQIKEEEKSKRADFEFKNNGSIKELKQKAELLLLVLKGMVNK